MSRRIVIEAVPQHEMRSPYNQEATGGDWFTDAEGNLVVRVIGEDIYRPETFLYALHELIEARLCQENGIDQDVVDEFDRRYDGEDEPGDDPACPYRTEHRQACLIEFLMADFLGVEGYGRME